MPIHEFVQATMFADDLGAGPQHQVKRVAKNDFRAVGGHFFGSHALDRAIGADRHEGGRLHTAAPKLERSGTRGTRCVSYRQSHAALSGVRNMESP